MDLVYYGDKSNRYFKKSIFLAGPTPRDKNVPSWRGDAIKIFNDLGFDGTLIIPEEPKKHYYEKENNFNEIKWDMEALLKADVVMMWLPREGDMLGLSSNVEFGYLLNKGNMIYGRPNTAFRCEFLDYLYKKELDRDYFSSLEELIKGTIKYIEKEVCNK